MNLQKRTTNIRINPIIMDIRERSKKYAEGRALSAIEAAIEQAYFDGYNDGLNHHENEKLEAIKEGVEYVDLDLPSGTLWSSTCINDGKKCRFLPYIEASKLSIPTKDQFEELYSNCKWQESFSQERVVSCSLIAKTGKEITIPYVNLGKVSRFIQTMCFWLRDYSESEEKDSAAIDFCNRVQPFITKKYFMGYKLPIMLVKNKQE